MGKTAKIVFIAIFVLIFTAGNGPCLAAQADWNISFIGAFQRPEGMHVAEFKDVKKMLDHQVAPKMKGVKTEKLPEGQKDLDKVTGVMKEMDMAAYQLTIDDGDGYHQAYMLAMRLHQNLGEAEGFFQQEIPDQQKQQVADMIGQVNGNLEKLAFYDPKSQFGARLLGLMPVQYLSVEGRQAYSVGARVMFQAEEFWFPLSARAYVFAVGNQMACVVMMTTDSERSFWDRIFQEMIPTLQSVPSV